MPLPFPSLEPTTVDLESPLRRSQRYLASAYDSVASLFDTTYPALREQRTGSRGRLTHAEQDVFRAAVVFAGAGVALRINSTQGAHDKYLEFVVQHLQDGPNLSAKRLAAVLVSGAPDETLRTAYIESLTGSSLQSQSQVTKSLAALGLQDERDLFKDSSLLNPLFKVRNQIAHEMDMTSASVSGRGKRSRHERTMNTYTTLCHPGLNYCQRVLNRLQESLPGAQS